MHSSRHDQLGWVLAAESDRQFNRRSAELSKDLIALRIDACRCDPGNRGLAGTPLSAENGTLPPYYWAAFIFPEIGNHTSQRTVLNTNLTMPSILFPIRFEQERRTLDYD